LKPVGAPTPGIRGQQAAESIVHELGKADLADARSPLLAEPLRAVKALSPRA
jgi:hypothetical protein